jgi:hypothetical protein
MVEVLDFFLKKKNLENSVTVCAAKINLGYCWNYFKFKNCDESNTKSGMTLSLIKVQVYLL